MAEIFYRRVNGRRVPLTAAELAQKAADAAEWNQRATTRDKEKSQRDRYANYPDIQEQLDAIWDFIIASEVALPAFTQSVKDKIETTRTEFPAEKAKVKNR